MSGEEKTQPLYTEGPVRVMSTATMQSVRSSPTQRRPPALMLFLLTAFVTGAEAQMSPPATGPLDPARSAALRPPPVSRLSEQFIWTANDAAAHDPALQARVRGQDDKTEPHFFRAHFHVPAVLSAATLYLAGPRSVSVFLNGQQVLTATDDGTRPKNLSVLSADVASALRAGDNVLAVEEVRGHSSLHTGASPTINQVTYGEVLALKIVPAAAGVNAPPLLISNTKWRSTLHSTADWQQPAFDDSSWPFVESLGVLGSKRDFLQWNADAGLYAWPGYSGISPDLRVFDLAASAEIGAGDTLLLDFKREVSGRLRLTSTLDKAIEVVASYGESREEAQKQKGYLGPRKIIVPAHGVAYGPKSAFRYVSLTHSVETSLEKLNIRVEGITYPVQYLGSFTSSDPMLNRIWETAAYTARLCMQDDIWDGVKRDRGRWMGDLDVTGRTLSTVFASPAVNALQERTMAEIIGAPPVTRDINTISGYSALWITGQANFYRHSGDLHYLRSLHPQLVSLLQLMDRELDAEGLFTNPDHHKVFVDWSEGFSADTPEARAATHFEFTLAYAEATFLLNELGDTEQAYHAREQLSHMSAAAHQHLLNNTTSTFGTRLQTNAIAVLSGVPASQERDAIWKDVLSHVGKTSAVVTPYYGYYVLSAMAALDHRREALDWMRTYWGGMLNEGATSFWEAYDPRWPKDDFHAFLEADGKRGYYVSLAHGWASGPAAWLAEQILGIRPTAAGFREVSLRPDLGGLAFARGAEPTPRGLLKVDLTPSRLSITLPPGTRATLEPPFTPDPTASRLNGQSLRIAVTLVDGHPQLILTRPGTYTFSTRRSVLR